MSGFPWRDQRPAGPLRKNLPVCSYHSQVDCVIARCLPEHQVQPGKELEQQGHRVLMVSARINDVPALATATGAWHWGPAD